MKLTTTYSASLQVRAGIGGQPVISNSQACGPMAFHLASGAIWLVNSTSHPVGGDNLELNVGVGVGCCLDVRSFSPTIARPGNEAARARIGLLASSTARTNVSVASDAVLAWCPEPNIATMACDHRTESVVQLASSARLAWRDESILDRRSGVALGTWISRLRVLRDGWPIFTSELGLGPGAELWESPVALEGARAVSFYLVVDPDHSSEWTAARGTASSATGVALPLSGPGIAFTAWGDDLGDCRRLIERLFEESKAPSWSSQRWASASQTQVDLRSAGAPVAQPSGVSS